MTRFDASTPAERRKLFVEAVTAHRERASAFCTFEADEDASATGDDDTADETLPPWVQFGDGTLNLDCTDAELDELKALLGEFPAFKIDDITRPEDAEGVNVRVSALADANRVAQCADRIFRDVYGQPEGFRAWVTSV